MRMLNEDFLPGFYAKLVAEYVVENLDLVASNLSKFGSQVTLGTLKAIPNRPHPASAIGDEVHDAIEQFVVHGADKPDNLFETITARRMYGSYKGFLDLHNPSQVRSEFTVWSYEYGYAGTGDLLWDIPELGGLGVVDTKTGTRIYPKTGMQCAALANADTLLSPEGAESPMPEIAWQGILHVRPMSAKLYVLQHTDANMRAFLACLDLFNWTRFYKGSVVPVQPHSAYPLQAPRHEGPLPERRWPA